MRRSSRDVAQTQRVGPRWGRRDRRDRRVHDVGCRVNPRHRYPRRNDSLRGHRDLYVRSHRGRRTSERIVYDDLVDRGREDAMAAPPHARHGGTRWRLVARWPSRPVRLLPRFRALVNARQRLGEAASDPRKPRRRLSIVVSGRRADARYGASGSRTPTTMVGCTSCGPTAAGERSSAPEERRSTGVLSLRKP